jgi:alkylated DNA repair dioxygenase AlkB
MTKTTRNQAPPEGFRYQADLLPPGEELDLVARIAELPLKEFEFQGYLAKRRVLSYGWQYDFDNSSLQPAGEIPPFLLGLREHAAGFAGLTPPDLPHALITEYSPGAAIGWHRDKGVFVDVIGVSLLSACNFRLRRKAGSGWERYSLTVEPRSIYLLRGPARTEWEHSIPGVETLRYSITFRSLRPGRRHAWPLQVRQLLAAPDLAQA